MEPGKDETIIAPASPSGQGAIGILRLSGSHSLQILNRHCRITSSRSTFSTHPRCMILCDFVDEQSQEVIDQGLAVFYKSPQSYTGEDSAEFFLHANPLLLARMVEAVLATGLARLARPGEFTQRAYLNKKLDLSQAEAVKQIINARSKWELAASQRNFQGELQRLVARLRSALLHLKAKIEAEIDFSIEIAEEYTKSSLTDQRGGQILQVLTQIEDLLQRSEETERLRSGFQVAILGAPNAGKSSLFNRILGWDRTIVSSQAGTTRDYVSEEIQLDGLAVRFIDTAGLHEAEDPIEQEGIRMARRILKQSQLLLYLVDGSRPPYEIKTDIFPKEVPLLIVLNKWDQPDARLHLPGLGDPIRISCHTGEGLEYLRKKLSSLALDKLDIQTAILLETRHRSHLLKAAGSLKRALELHQNQAPDEIMVLEIDRCIDEIGAITAPLRNEEILGRIFSLFCIGK